MKDWSLFPLNSLPVGDGKGADRTLGNKALQNIGTASGFHTRIVDLPNGDQMLVKTKNGMPEFTVLRRATTPDDFYSSALVAINIEAKLVDMYMTSGAYAFGPLGGINGADPTLTIEPVTYKSDAVASSEAAVLTPLYDKAPPNNGDISKIYNHTVMPGALNTPKATMMVNPPSMFSGLMRRCMQGRYGSGNTSLHFDQDGSVSAGNSFGYCTGILKFDGTYILVALSSGGSQLDGRYWRLEFPSEYAELLSGDFDAAKETLALSAAFVRAETEKQLEPSAIPNGGTISYGWSFSLTTNLASCVINEMLDYGYDRRIYSLLSLVFSYDDETSDIGYALNVDEQVDGTIKPVSAPIWAPFSGNTIWYNARLFSPDPTGPQNFPVHSFYVDDALKIIRWQWSSVTNPAYNSTAWNNACVAANWQSYFFGEGSASYFVQMNYGQTVTHGFTLDGVGARSESTDMQRRLYSIKATYKTPLWDVPPQDASYGFATEAMYVTLYPGDTYNDHNPYIYPTGYLLGTAYPPNLRTGNHWSVTRITNHVYEIDRMDYRGSASHSTALVIPNNDCAAVYLGYHETLSSGLKSVARSVGGVGKGCIQEWSHTTKDGIRTYTKWCADVRRQVNANTSGMSIGGETVTSYTDSTNQLSYEITLYGKTPLVVGDVDSQIFHANATNTVLSSPVVNVSSSIYGDSRHHIGALGASEIGTTSEYPIDITLFVGAS